jgi:hypothetical protein
MLLREYTFYERIYLLEAYHAALANTFDYIFMKSKSKGLCEISGARQEEL